MGLMTFLRNRAGYILVFAIGFAIVAFLVGDAINVGKPFWSANQKVVGSVDGNDISIDDFQPKVDQSLNQFKQQYGGSLNPQMTAMAVDQAWNAELGKVLLTKEYDRLGLTVSEDELVDLLQGQNPSPLIKQYFANPQTGQLDRATLMNFLKSKEPQALQQSTLLQQEITNQALQTKYSNLIRNSVYVTSLEATDEYTNRNKLANFKYVSLDYSSIPDATVKLTDADYSAYYDQNKARFNNPQESRSFDYVSFDIKPTSGDSAAVKSQIDKIAADFKTAKNDSLFAAINSEVKVPFTYLTKGKLDPAVDSAVFALPAGSFYGPVLSNNSYKLVKVVDTRFSPDSVKASHILIDPAKVGGEDKAIKLADSLKGLIQKGGNFAQLAKTYSVDGSKDKGGELGTFARGAMVPEFENAVFDGKAGDIKVVKSQFGVHVIKIEKQIGSSKVAKLAYIEKALAPSSKTQAVAYKAASSFLNDVKGKDFSKYAKDKGLKVAVADKVSAIQGFAPGLDNPRKLIQDAYAADQGDVLPEIYTMTNAYVVAHLTDVKPKGTLTLAQVKKEIEPMVRNAVKAKMLTDKFNSAGKASLAQVASKVGRTVNPVQNIVFANPILPGIAQENKLVGSVFGAQPGKVSAPVDGERGVYVFSVDGFTNPAPIANMFKQKESMLLSLGQRSLQSAFQALQDNAKIKDNRVKFY
ncbi:MULTISPECIES: peptidylprolyl isomerase [unclassified Pedobacter]|uniref:peptidylprolyl isomerase n=1 Tax=unclassified Pedobacter TaxID=2628915 RepID=UPI000B4B3FBB|nr:MULTISPECIES: SurA N-terminal domain-containing protein [unclassified Pedobacter]MCX2432309.1 SurA N-terminal domain-containing protein [Pedobacter sp. GR22-10]MCX2582841.1 SurA N-terminal domain-containing protein [Pedobacter sp. MR22-3]OWK71292.1 peptidylprolyl isomerase [Pedobacter sp. AJM]